MENIESGTGTRLGELSESVAAVAGPGSVAALRGPNYFDGSREVDHSISIFAGIFTFVFGSLGYPLLPMIVGALQDHLHFTIRQVGAIASGEMSGMFLSAALALLWIRKVDWRWTALGCCIALIACHILSGQVSSFEALLGLRFMAGLFGGSMMAIGATAVGDTSNPEANVALLNVAQTALCAIGFYVMPPLVDSHGTSGAFLFLAVYVLPALAIAMLLPAAGRWPKPADAARVARPAAKHAVAVLLFVSFPAFLFFAGYAASWAYIERIGVTAGLTHKEVGTALSISLIAGSAGSIAAFLLRMRLGRLIPTFVTLLCQLASLAVLMWFLHGPYLYLGALMVFVFFVNFPNSYQVGLAVNADSTGRAAVVFLLMLKAGIAVAPYLAAAFVSGNDFHGPMILGAILYTLSFLNFWAAEMQTRRRTSTG
jgi:predicted MFS family arabinose efflux permease